MATKPITSLICYDDHRSFTEDVKKRFADKVQYNVVPFHTRQDLMDYCTREADSKVCKVAILGVPESREQFHVIEEISMEIKKCDPDTSLILLCSPDRMDDLKKVVRFNIDAYIPRNANSILRIHNAVKKKISEHGIGMFKKKRNLSLWVLAGFLVIALLVFLFARIRFPEYF
jgi:hypothetical protein